MGLLYTSIRVRNMKRSVDFYTKLLGMRVVGKRAPVPGEQVVVLKSKDTGQSLQLMYYSKKFEHYKPYEKGDEMDHLMFGVSDAKKMYNKLIRKGARAATKLWERENFAMGFVKDPDGIWVGLRSGEMKMRPR
jgi:lactoylglutathione lyase